MDCCCKLNGAIHAAQRGFLLTENDPERNPNDRQRSRQQNLRRSDEPLR